jgi:hypothetical protein
MRDWSYVARVKSTLEQTLAGVAAAKQEGLSLARTTERVQLPEARDAFVQGIETRRAGYEAFFRPTLIRNAWEELDADIMKAARSATVKRIAEGVYLHGDGTSGVTVLINDKDVVLVNPPDSAAAARASVRAIRELTDKPVRYVVNTAARTSSPAGVEVFREIYTQAELVSAAPSGPGIAVADVLTLHRGSREIRISRAPDGSLVVEVPQERLRIARNGRVEIALRSTL